MQGEEVPLLADSSEPGLYERFSARTKRWIVAQVSWAGFVPLFVSGSFIPAIPQIASEFDSSPSVVSQGVSISILANAIGSLCWATYSGFYGRRPIYLVSIPIFCLGSLGVTFSQSVPELLAFRALQAFGCSSGMIVGGAVIGDIYKSEERGTAMGIFFGAALLGPAMAPTLGGLATYMFTWRAMQFAIFVGGLIAFLLICVSFPETSHPQSRGIDKYRSESGVDDARTDSESRTFKWVWLNPFKCLWLLRSPNVLLVALTSAFIYVTDFVLLVSLSYTTSDRYGIHNEALIGAFYIPLGLGNIIGAPLSGRISDQILIKWRKRRGGEWIPEDRLRGTLIGAGLLVPTSVLASGLVIKYVDGTPGVVLNLICMFVNGIGADLVITPMFAYLVDIMHSQSAEVLAAATGSRSAVIAAATALIIPLIDTIGVLGTDTVAAAIGWLGFILIWSLIRYGGKMRVWMDIGFSTAS